jgi:hypothetical protein
LVYADAPIAFIVTRLQALFRALLDISRRDNALRKIDQNRLSIGFEETLFGVTALRIAAETAISGRNLQYRKTPRTTHDLFKNLRHISFWRFFTQPTARVRLHLRAHDFVPQEIIGVSPLCPITPLNQFVGGTFARILPRQVGRHPDPLDLRKRLVSTGSDDTIAEIDLMPPINGVARGRSRVKHRFLLHGSSFPEVTSAFTGIACSAHRGILVWKNGR